MRKFLKAFRGVKDGDIYPTDFEAGEDCPPELEAGAESLDALAPTKAAKPEKAKESDTGKKDGKGGDSGEPEKAKG